MGRKPSYLISALLPSVLALAGCSDCSWCTTKEKPKQLVGGTTVTPGTSTAKGWNDKMPTNAGTGTATGTMPFTGTGKSGTGVPTTGTNTTHVPMTGVPTSDMKNKVPLKPINATGVAPASTLVPPDPDAPPSLMPHTGVPVDLSPPPSTIRPPISVPPPSRLEPPSH